MQKFRILSINGGGIRGVIPATILAHIERETGKPAHQLFDLIVGTSTGGLIACALTKPGPLSAAQIQQTYLGRGREIFSRSTWEAVKSLGSLAGPKYGAAGLERVLTDMLGPVTLAQAVRPCAVTSYDISARAPRVLSSWGAYKAMHMVHAARATSAGPTFFPPFQQYIDGGVVANNPSAVALAEACSHFGVETDDCLVLSLGTGADERPIDPSEASGWGALSWIQPLVSVFTDGAVDLVHYGMNEAMPRGQYLYMQPALKDGQGDMDNVDPKNMLSLVATAHSLIQAEQPQLDAFLGKLSV
jgi:patatin-like phospholipase/acyl hydrolase